MSDAAGSSRGSPEVGGSNAGASSHQEAEEKQDEERGSKQRISRPKKVVGCVELTEIDTDLISRICHRVIVAIRGRPIRLPRR